MFKKISRSAEINEKLEKEGKIRFLDSAEDLAKITSMNLYMDEVRKDYQMKERLSQISASQVILNA
ncbi:MAG: hypothetical protein Q8S54_02180 [Bacteroidota bacterium]|nr:hypothetical protein [Odoribacter sp.]MDP3641978.1 hypothetical protein [Bacteroidota bacterium]